MKGRRLGFHQRINDPGFYLLYQLNPGMFSFCSVRFDLCFYSNFASIMCIEFASLLLGFRNILGVFVSGFASFIIIFLRN
ncbi:hypothetical protein HanXRQr2_Chr11g0506581 [Helianthus annuus]|uniref:Uncharacterized protein n=1 Tax=Helianthus annuus TaxID=4232 RepID=A0A9K3N1R5_HELAN|nr:hypothetical protein HanXRQr2_Chr11g0506581 [Helianthus annuus]